MRRSCGWPCCLRGVLCGYSARACASVPRIHMRAAVRRSVPVLAIGAASVGTALDRRRRRTRASRCWSPAPEVRLSDDIIGSVVAETRNGPPPDAAALSRIARERAVALKKLERDRDVALWQTTMRRLDAEEAATRAQNDNAIPAAKVVEYLRDLGVTWERASGGPGRRQFAEAVFSEIRALGFKEMEFELTDEAQRMGLGAALPEGRFTVGVSGYGRGERARADTFQIFVTIVDGSASDHVRRTSEVA